MHRAPSFARLSLDRFSLMTLFLALGLAIAPATVQGSAAGREATVSCGTFSIYALGFESLSILQDSPFDSWAEIDDVLFACGADELFDALRDTGHPAMRYWQDVPLERLFVVRGAHPGSFHDDGDLEILVRGGPYSVIWAGTETAWQAMSAGQLPEATGDTHAGCGHAQVQPLAGGMVLARQSVNRAVRGTTVFGPEAELAADTVDGARWFTDVETLAGWNRWTLGAQIDLARDWLVAQLGAMPGLSVSTQVFEVNGTPAENVIAVLPGSTRPDDWVLVGAHYDAISQSPGSSAPGAEDNASGCAGVLELARVITAMPPEATVIFLCYSGEEQGLFGSVAHADELVSQGEDAKVDLMLNMDMIGYTGDADLDCLLETDPPFATVLDPFVDAAEAFTTLRSVTSLNAFGSDHVPYLNRNMPALLTIENDWDSYSSYHRTSDLPQNITVDMGYQVLRMNAAVLAHVAGAVGVDQPIFIDGFETGDTTAWSSVAE
ncbi:MAG: M28 family peptidase [Acidobacteriota bacterium]